MFCKACDKELEQFHGITMVIGATSRQTAVCHDCLVSLEEFMPVLYVASPLGFTVYIAWDAALWVAAKRQEAEAFIGECVDAMMDIEEAFDPCDWCFDESKTCDKCPMRATTGQCELLTREVR